MIDRSSPAPGVTTATHAHDLKPHTHRAPSTEVWYSRGVAKLWRVANIIAALAVSVVASGHVAGGILIAWLLFTGINAICYPVLIEVLRLEGRRAGAAVPGLAFVFGVSWGALFLGVAPAVPANELVAVSLIGLLVALTAIPVFSVHRGGYPLFAIPLAAAAIPALNAGAAVDHSGAYAAGLFLFLIVAAAIYGRGSRTLLQALGSFAAVAGADRDVTAADTALSFKLQTRSLKRLKHERDRSRSTLAAVAEAVVTATDAGLVDYMNPVAEVLTGIEHKDANGLPLASVVRLTTNGGQATLDTLLARVHAGETLENRGEGARLQRHDGVEYEIEYRISTLAADDGSPMGTICLLRDITAQRRLLEQAAWDATHDPLTKLLSQSAFEQRLEHLLANRGQAPVSRQSMCYIDLDQFRYVADAHGIDGANHALATVAGELRRKVRTDDMLGRLGADRFGLLLTDCAVDKAGMIAAAIAAAVGSLELNWAGKRIGMTASIGVVEVGAPGDDISRVFARAKTACQRAKSGGGNQVQAIDERDQAEQFRIASRRRLIEIRAAIEAGKLELYYHPFLPMRPPADARICEVLVRMPEPDREFLLPREFLVTEEHLALLPRLDRWSVQATMEAMRSRNTVLDAMESIFVTISGQSINDDRFLSFIIETLADDVARSRLCFKIAEADSITEVERARYFVAKLKSLGCRIALDNFGVGIGSFALLKRLQIDYLKINSETVTNMPYSSVDYEIVLATSRIAKALGTETVAEGVTTHATRQALFGLGVDYVQGLLSGRPAPIAVTDAVPAETAR